LHNILNKRLSGSSGHRGTTFETKLGLGAGFITARGALINHLNLPQVNKLALGHHKGRVDDINKIYDRYIWGKDIKKI
jgi:hypothetical protein